MLDIQFIRENEEQIRSAIANKNVPLDFDRFLKVDAERREILQQWEELKSLKNDLKALMASAATPEERDALIAKGKQIKAKLDEIEPRYKKIENEFADLMAELAGVATAIGRSLPASPGA